MKTILFDAELMRPGCVLLAAVANTDRHVVQRFNSRSWLTSPTPAMKRYEVSDEQLAVLVERVNAAHPSITKLLNP